MGLIEIITNFWVKLYIIIKKWTVANR